MQTVKNTKKLSEKEALEAFILEVSDSAMILGQRLGELTGHGPTLEVDMALTNISLDLFGQVRSYLQYAAENSDKEIAEDDLAFLRTEREMLNVLLVEQPNTDFAYTIGRQFLFDHFHFLFIDKMQHSKDATLAAIARKGIKEVAYHRDFSSDWILRLGDGTEESHERIQKAINDLWAYTDELFHKTEACKMMIEKGIGVDVDELRETYQENVSDVLQRATLDIPDLKFFQEGGKKGIHSEHMGHLLTEMQYMQRTYPGMKW